MDDALRVIWDTETTGVERRAELVSIGWCSEDESACGEVFSIPTCDIHPGALAVHGLDEDTLVEKGAGNIREAVETFFAAIESLERNVILVAHNGKSFDTHKLRFAMTQANIHELPPNLCGFADTLPWVRSVKASIGCVSCSLDAVCARAGIDTASRAEHHGALVDSEVLLDLLRWLEIRFGRMPAAYIETAEQFMQRTQI